MLGVSEPEALNFYTFFRLILLTLFLSRNLILIYLPLSGSLNSLLRDIIASTPGLASLFSDATHASGGVITFVRQGLSFSEFSSFSLSLLDFYFDYAGVNISLSNSSSPFFFNVCAPPIRASPTDSRTDSFSFSILFSSTNLFFLGDYNCHYLLWDSKRYFRPP